LLWQYADIDQKESDEEIVQDWRQSGLVRCDYGIKYAGPDQCQMK